MIFRVVESEGKKCRCTLFPKCWMHFIKAWKILVSWNYSWSNWQKALQKKLINSWPSPFSSSLWWHRISEECAAGLLNLCYALTLEQGQSTPRFTQRTTTFPGVGVMGWTWHTSSCGRGVTVWWGRARRCGRTLQHGSRSGGAGAGPAMFRLCPKRSLWIRFRKALPCSPILMCSQSVFSHHIGSLLVVVVVVLPIFSRVIFNLVQWVIPRRALFNKTRNLLSLHKVFMGEEGFKVAQGGRGKKK